MGNDFTSGFSIEKMGKQRKLITYYKVTETKIAEICPYCLQPTVTHGQKMKKHELYAVIDNQFARCVLYRWYYHCESCGKPFFNTTKRDAYDFGDEFSCNFVEKAICYWLESEKTAIYAVAKEIGISKDKEYEWNDTLIQFFRETYVTKLPCSPIGFYRFLDKDGKCRGMICTPDSAEKKMRLVSFIDDYSADGILQVLKNTKDCQQLDIYTIMFDYAPGLLSVLEEYFPYVNKSINANNLRSQLLTLLHLLPDDAECNKNDLDISLPNYCSSFNPENLREWLLRYQEVGLGEFAELLLDPKAPIEKWKYGELIGQFYNCFFSHYDMKDIRETIDKLQNRSIPASYEFIVVKMLYGSKEYKKEYIDAISKVAAKEGRIFENILGPIFDQSQTNIYDY